MSRMFSEKRVRHPPKRMITEINSEPTKSPAKPQQNKIPQQHKSQQQSKLQVYKEDPGNKSGKTVKESNPPIKKKKKIPYYITSYTNKLGITIKLIKCKKCSGFISRNQTECKRCNDFETCKQQGISYKQIKKPGTAKSVKPITKSKSSLKSHLTVKTKRNALFNPLSERNKPSSSVTSSKIKKSSTPLRKSSEDTKKNVITPNKPTSHIKTRSTSTSSIIKLKSELLEVAPVEYVDINDVPELLSIKTDKIKTERVAPTEILEESQNDSSSPPVLSIETELASIDEIVKSSTSRSGSSLSDLTSLPILKSFTDADDFDSSPGPLLENMYTSSIVGHFSHQKRFKKKSKKQKLTKKKRMCECIVIEGKIHICSNCESQSSEYRKSDTYHNENDESMHSLDDLENTVEIENSEDETDIDMRVALQDTSEDELPKEQPVSEDPLSDKADSYFCMDHDYAMSV